MNIAVDEDEEGISNKAASLPMESTDPGSSSMSEAVKAPTTPVQKEMITLSNGFQVEVWPDEARGYTHLSSLPEFTAPIANPWEFYEEVVARFSPRSKAQWVYISLLMHLYSHVKELHEELTRAMEHMEGFWNDTFVVRAALFATTGQSYYHYYHSGIVVRALTLMTPLEEYESCYLRNALGMRRRDLSPAADHLLSYNALLRKHIFHESAWRSLLGMKSLRRRKGDTQVVMWHSTGYGSLIHGWSAAAQDHLGKLKDRLEQEGESGKDSLELLWDAIEFLEEHAPRHFDEEPTALGLGLYSKRSAFSLQLLLELYLLVKGYNMEWAMVAMGLGEQSR